MKLEKFNPKKVHELVLESKYNIETRKGEILVGELGRSTNDEDAEYYFSGDFGLYDIDYVVKIAPYIEFGYVQVGDGFALTKNGSKVFRENIHGVIDDEDIAKHHVHYMNYNANCFTPDTIHQNDIIECISTHFNAGAQGIVTEVRKPIDLEDHGTVEVFMFDKKQFDHFTYTGWNKFLKVIEEYN